MPIEFFVGRGTQLTRISQRGFAQVAAGKPGAIFIQGEYGIGKSSVAKYALRLAEQEYGLHGIYVTLGGAWDLSDVGKAILEGTLRSGALGPKRLETLRNTLAKYIEKQDILGLVTISADALKADLPNFSTHFGILGFLEQVHQGLNERTDTTGLALVLDEINGIAGDAQFSHFFKGLVDTNAMSEDPTPLLLMVCGTEERRHQLIATHPPVDRIVDVIEISLLSNREVDEFFERAFSTVPIEVDPEAGEILSFYSQGYPMFMHIIGDAVYWKDQDGFVNRQESLEAILEAAGEIGRRYVDQQGLQTLRNRDYREILERIGMSSLSMVFTRSELAEELSSDQRRKLDSFLRRMRELNVMARRDHRGEYEFKQPIVRLYVAQQAIGKTLEAVKGGAQLVSIDFASSGRRVIGAIPDAER